MSFEAHGADRNEGEKRTRTSSALTAAATDNCSNQELQTLVQDRESFVWKDCHSPNPAACSVFLESYSATYGEKHVSTEEARTAYRTQLKNRYDPQILRGEPLVAAFDPIAMPESWESVLAML